MTSRPANAKDIDHFLPEILKSRRIQSDIWEALHSLITETADKSCKDLHILYATVEKYLLEKKDFKTGYWNAKYFRIAGLIEDRVWDTIYTAVLEYKKEVARIEAWGSGAGQFDIIISVIGGAYSVWAPEFDEVGYFKSKKEAIEYAEIFFAPCIEEFESFDEDDPDFYV